MIEGIENPQLPKDWLLPEDKIKEIESVYKGLTYPEHVSLLMFQYEFVREKLLEAQRDRMLKKIKEQGWRSPDEVKAVCEDCEKPLLRESDIQKKIDEAVRQERKIIANTLSMRIGFSGNMGVDMWLEEYIEALKEGKEVSA